MIAVHQTRPAGRAGQWLQYILQPVVEACGFDNPPPLEVRPTGGWGGWCYPEGYAPDGRVCVSSQIVLWRKEHIISVYLHESSHRLLARWPDEFASHGPIFFTLNSLLLARCKSFFQAQHEFAEMGFYDLQDRPAELVNFPNWREMCLRFARETFTELGRKQCSAEHLAAEVVAAWPRFVDKVDAEFKLGKADALKLQNFPLISKNFEKRIRELKLWGWTFFTFWLMTFWLPIWMFFKLAAR